MAVALSAGLMATAARAPAQEEPSAKLETRLGSPPARCLLAGTDLRPAGSAGPQPGCPMSQGTLDGQLHAQRFQSRAVLGGLATGLLTGPIGTVAGAYSLGPAKMDPMARHATEGGDTDYQVGFQTGWDNQTRHRRQNAFLGGGALGSAVFTAVALSVWACAD
jgi:hypothetical protein